MEVLVVMVILAILIGLAIPMVDALRRRAERAACVSQMRSLHASFDSFIADNRQWPQVPESIKGEEDYWAFWTQVLVPYGADARVWLCPTEKRALAQDPDFQKKGGIQFQGSYVPTQFGPGEFTPFRWDQPWLAEKADYHGGGFQLIMPDGSIRTGDQLLGSN